MEDRFTLVVEGHKPDYSNSWGYRIRTKRPGGEIRTICSWLPAQSLTDQTVTEQLQVIEDCWVTLVKQFVGIQGALSF